MVTFNSEFIGTLTSNDGVITEKRKRFSVELNEYWYEILESIARIHSGLPKRDNKQQFLKNILRKERERLKLLGFEFKDDGGNVFPLPLENFNDYCYQEILAKRELKGL